MKSKPFTEEMRGKFFGTTSFFAWDTRPIPKHVLFLLLFEPPHPIDSALMLTLGQKIKSQLLPPKIVEWSNRFDVVILSVNEWNQRYQDYPAAIL